MWRCKLGVGGFERLPDRRLRKQCWRKHRFECRKARHIGWRVAGAGLAHLRESGRFGVDDRYACFGLVGNETHPRGNRHYQAVDGPAGAQRFAEVTVSRTGSFFDPSQAIWLSRWRMPGFRKRASTADM